MRIHTADETIAIANQALRHAKAETLIPSHVYIDVLIQRASRTRAYAAEVHLAASHKSPGDRRRYANTGHNGADRGTFAASYDEWGHFLAALFELDPAAVAGPYKSRDDFHAQTRNAYYLVSATS